MLSQAFTENFQINIRHECFKIIHQKKGVAQCNLLKRNESGIYHYI